MLVGLLIWKFKGGDDTTSQAQPPPSASVVATAPKPELLDSLPPPPKDDTPPPEASAAKTVKSGSGGGPSPCGGTCTGTPSVGTRGDISSRAGSARGCYERALRNNSMLQGKLTVAVRVDPSGNVCSASIASDSIGSGDVSSCVLGMFRGQRVAPPQGGCADMTVPLNFQPKK